MMQEECPFPIIIDNFWVCVSHFEWMITVTHNTFYNSQLFFSALNMNFATNVSCLKIVFLPNLTYIGVKALNGSLLKITV